MHIEDMVKGKRLLMLGATGYFCEAVKQAKSLGIYTIVTDYFPNSPAKRIADSAYDISTTDIDALEQMAIIEQIDGIFVAWSDINHYIAEELCRRLHLPFYATREQLYRFTNKRAFKDYCRKCGVPTVPEFRLTEKMLPEDMAGLQYPIIIKPTDSYSGKGITICSSESEVADAVREALSNSRSGEFLAEKYMDDTNYDTVGIYYTIQNGVAALSSMTDRCMSEFTNKKRLNTAIFYPSQYLDRYIREVDPLVKNMLHQSDIKNGVIFFEGCVNQNGFTLWESGFRLCGAQQNIFPAYINQIDSQKMLLCHALTGQMADKDLIAREDPYFKGKSACNGLVFLNTGKIKKIEGIEEILEMPGLLNFTQLKQTGDTVRVEDIGTLNQSFARFHAVANSRSELCTLVDQIFSKLLVCDEQGHNMCLHIYDFESINKAKRWK